MLKKRCTLPGESRSGSESSGVPYQARAEVGAKAAVYPTRRELKWERKQRCTLPYSGSENSEGLSVALSPLLFKEAFN